MPLGSFNRKSTTSNDNRVAATDNALVIQPGGFLFNPGRGTEQIPALGGGQVSPASVLPLVIVAAVAAVFVAGVVFWRRK